MKPWFLEAASSSVLAAVSTLHVALALIRKHRSPDLRRGRILGAISASFAVCAWVWTSPRDLAAGVAAHLVWFAVSSRLGGARQDPEPLPAVARPVTAQTRTRPGAAAPAAGAEAARLSADARARGLRRDAGDPHLPHRAARGVRVSRRASSSPCRSSSMGARSRAATRSAPARKRAGTSRFRSSGRERSPSTLHSTVRPGSTLSDPSARGARSSTRRATIGRSCWCRAAWDARP